MYTILFYITYQSLFGTLKTPSEPEKQIKQNENSTNSKTRPGYRVTRGKSKTNHNVKNEIFKRLPPSHFNLVTDSYCLVTVSEDRNTDLEFGDLIQKVYIN